MQFITYLSFSGTCKQAFEFYAKCFGGKIDAMIPFSGAPGGGGVPAEWQDKIMHVRMSSGNQTLMGADPPPQYSTPMGGFSVSVMVDRAAEAEHLFAALSEGNSKVKMPIQETFWADRFGMLIDQFGTPWMVNCEKKMQA
jgi:PhnB protein